VNEAGSVQGRPGLAALALPRCLLGRAVRTGWGRGRRAGRGLWRLGLSPTWREAIGGLARQRMRPALGAMGRRRGHGRRRATPRRLAPRAFTPGGRGRLRAIGDGTLDRALPEAGTGQDRGGLALLRHRDKARSRRGDPRWPHVPLPPRRPATRGAARDWRPPIASESPRGVGCRDSPWARSWRASR